MSGVVREARHPVSTVVKVNIRSLKNHRCNAHGGNNNCRYQSEGYHIKEKAREQPCRWAGILDVMR